MIDRSVKCRLRLLAVSIGCLCLVIGCFGEVCFVVGYCGAFLQRWNVFDVFLEGGYGEV